MFLRILLICGLIFCRSNVFAHEQKTAEAEQVQSDRKTEAKSDPKDSVSLEEIVVTATRTEIDVASTPGDVHVVTKKDIEQRNIKSVDEALNTMPGVFNRRGKGLMDTLANISLRGIPGANRTLIMKDGMVLNDAYTGDVTWAGMSTEDIERIEVVEGPFSSLYGGYAMGGVVNIITKMPEKREVTLKSGYGTSWHSGEAYGRFPERLSFLRR